MPFPACPPMPKQARAQATYRALMTAATELLEQGGMEAVTTNRIVARAGLTPPAFYRYFRDKFDIVRRAASELMAAQNAQIDALLAAGEMDQDSIETLLRTTVAVTRKYPGGAALLGAMRALPQLRDIRLESHRLVATGLARQVSAFHLNLPEESAYRRARLAVELGYAAVELVFEDPGDDEADTLEQAARAIMTLTLN